MTAVSLTDFDVLVARNRAEVLRVCRSILRDDHLGRDAAQETFLRLWKRIVAGREPERSSAWLRRVAVSTSLDLARTRRARTEEASVPDSLADRRTTSSPQRDDAADAELRSRFEHAIEELPEGQRTVFLLRHEGNLPLAQVAETLGVSLPTVKTQFARACLKLQEKLAAFRPEGRSERR